MVSTTRLEEIKSELFLGNTSGFQTLITNKPSEDVFQTIREQKLLFLISDNIAREKIIDLYRESVNQILDQPLTKTENLYCDFVSLIASKRHKIQQSLNDLIAGWKVKVTLVGTIEVLNAVFEAQQKLHHKQFIKFLEAKGTDLEHDKRSELTAFALHMANARNNDVAFAVTNLINYVAQHHVSFNAVDQPFDEEIIERMIYESSSLVATQFLIDKISYGEWTVSEIKNTEKAQIQFETTDIRFEMARELGIRSDLVSFNIKRKETRWLHNVLENICIRFLEEAIEKYKGQDKLLFYMQRHFNLLKSNTHNFLEMLDAEDELLVGVKPDPYILAHYIVAAAFMCFSRAAEFCREHMAKKHDRSFLCYRLPVEVLKIFFINDVEISEHLDTAITNLTTRVPAKQHFSIINNPYIQIAGDIYGLSALNRGIWVNSVRSLLYSGGDVSNSVGRSWEGFTAKTLEDHGWLVIGTGIGMGGKLPDIDILAVRRTVMLMIQFKSTYTSSINTFEQWKSKQRIMKGAEQAFKISEAIKSDKTLLDKVVSADVLRSLQTIQPLVITNASIFNGWSYLNIPVMSSGSLMQILNGVFVKFMSADNKIVSTKRYSSSHQMTDDEFLKFVNQPLDWKMSNNELQVSYERHEIEELVFQIPNVKRRDGLGLHDVIPTENDI